MRDTDSFVNTGKPVQNTDLLSGIGKPVECRKIIVKR